MPPKDKAQLTEDEIYFISQWINEGANTDIKLNELAEDDTLKQLTSVVIRRYQHAQENKSFYSFNFASSETIEKLSKPNRTVFQLPETSPLFKLNFT